MDNQERFKKHMTMASELWGKEITPTLVQVYWKSLNDFTDDQVAAAFEQAVVSLRFFPKPVELIEIITGKAEEQAHAAWAVVELDLRDSRSANKNSSDEVCEIVRQLGGFRHLAGLTSRELEFKKRDFVQLYSMKSDRGVVPALPMSTDKIGCDDVTSLVEHKRLGA